MPFYKYKCSNCQNETNHMLKVDLRKEPTKVNCGKCGQPDIKHVIGTTNIIGGLIERHQKPSWFTDKIKEIKKDAGKGHTLDHAL